MPACVVLSVWKAPSLLLKASIDLPLSSAQVSPCRSPQAALSLSGLGPQGSHSFPLPSQSLASLQHTTLVQSAFGDSEDVSTPKQGALGGQSGVCVALCSQIPTFHHVPAGNMWDWWLDLAGKHSRAVSPLPSRLLLLSWRELVKPSPSPSHRHGWSPLTMPLSSSTLINSGDNHLPDRESTPPSRARSKAPS